MGHKLIPLYSNCAVVFVFTYIYQLDLWKIINPVMKSNVTPSLPVVHATIGFFFFYLERVTFYGLTEWHCSRHMFFPFPSLANILEPNWFNMCCHRRSILYFNKYFQMKEKRKCSPLGIAIAKSRQTESPTSGCITYWTCSSSVCFTSQQSEHTQTSSV